LVNEACTGTGGDITLNFAWEESDDLGRLLNEACAGIGGEAAGV